MVAVDYFGHDALVRLHCDGLPEAALLARTLGGDAPEPGQRLSVELPQDTHLIRRSAESVPAESISAISCHDGRSRTSTKR